MGLHSETVIVVFKHPDQQEGLEWMVRYHGTWEEGQGREDSSLPACCSETRPGALGAWTVITAAVPAPKSLASDFTCNYPGDKKDFVHPPSSPSSSLSFYSPSLSTFLLSFYLPNKPSKVHGCREISPKVTFYPGLGLRERAACHVP